MVFSYFFKELSTEKRRTEIVLNLIILSTLVLVEFLDFICLRMKKKQSETPNIRTFLVNNSLKG